MLKKILFVVLISLSINITAQLPTIIAHRGASNLAPENTLASTMLAWELGAQAVECDIWLTKDMKVVVFHDKKGKRLTGYNFLINEVNYTDIKNYAVKLSKTNLKKYTGEKIPLLENLLSTVPDDRTLVIEIKTGPEILPCLKQVLDMYWKSGKINFIAFDFDAIMEAKKLYPDVPCYYLSAFKADINKKFDVIAKSELNGVSLRYQIITPELVKKFREFGKNVACWTVDNPEDAKMLIDAGVVAITTNRPKWLKEQLEN